MKYSKNYFMIGVDEAGRGPLAGPVVAGAVAISNLLPHKFLVTIKDSKQLSEKQREKIYKEIMKCPDFVWGVGIVSEKVIDKINILNATKLAMQKAVNKVVANLRDRENKRQVFILVDGNMKFNDAWFGKDKLGASIKYKSIIKGDQKVLSISSASIIAKVTRDKIMQKYAKQYPEYGFSQHKGYGTKLHFEALEKFGPCKIHRKTFYPVNKYF